MDFALVSSIKAPLKVNDAGIVTGYAENAIVGFELLRYETPEQSNQQVCLLVNGLVHMNFNVTVNSHIGIAGIYAHANHVVEIKMQE